MMPVFVQIVAKVGRSHSIFAAIGTARFTQHFASLPTKNVTEAVGIEVDSNYARSARPLARVIVIQSDYRTTPESRWPIQLDRNQPTLCAASPSKPGDKVRRQEKFSAKWHRHNGLAGYLTVLTCFSRPWLAEGDFSWILLILQ